MAREQGLLVLRARGHELERAFTWGVARSLLESSLAGRPPGQRDELLAGPAAPARAVFDPDGSTAAPSDVEEAAFGIVHALYWLAIRLSESEPLLLEVDDAHWADEPLLRLLVYLLGRLSDQPLAVVVAARAAEHGEGRLLDQLAGDAAARVRVLEPLGFEAVAAPIRERVGAADEAFCRRCFELTAGNPLQVRERRSKGVLRHR
jgi:predicted ATPase